MYINEHILDFRTFYKFHFIESSSDTGTHIYQKI